MDGWDGMDGCSYPRAGLRALLFGLNTLLGLVSLLRALPFPILVTVAHFHQKIHQDLSLLGRPQQL